jgi:hypothetical protein
MNNQVSGSSFVFNTVTYTAPAAGSYRIGVFVEGDSRLGGEIGSNVNRDGDTTDVFAVLWSTSTNTVWVDTNQNNSFADDMAMTDYKVNYDVNYFGTDNPATPIAERLPFVVQTDGKNKAVNIGIVSGAHGSHVAGIAAGNGLFGGAMSGAAPGAEIVSVRVRLFISGCTVVALVKGMIYAAKQSDVDVINMSIGGLPPLNDGNNARAALYDRLVETYNVQIFISAGNSGPGMNTVGDPSVATNVMSVGAYITDDTYLADYGAQLYEADNLHFVRGTGQHRPERLPRHAGRWRGYQRSGGRRRRRQLHPHVHLPPDQRLRRHRDVRPRLGRQRRHIQLRWVDRPAEGCPGHPRRGHQPRDERRPLRDPQARRSDGRRHRVPDDECRHCRGSVQWA